NRWSRPPTDPRYRPASTHGTSRHHGASEFGQPLLAGPPGRGPVLEGPEPPNLVRATTQAGRLETRGGPGRAFAGRQRHLVACRWRRPRRTAIRHAHSTEAWVATLDGGFNWA